MEYEYIPIINMCNIAGINNHSLTLCQSFVSDGLPILLSLASPAPPVTLLLPYFIVLNVFDNNNCFVNTLYVQ